MGVSGPLAEPIYLCDPGYCAGPGADGAAPRGEGALTVGFLLGDMIGSGEVPKLPCWRKEKWDSLGKAQAQLRSLLKRPFVKDVDRLNAYQCPHCHKYHIGRKPVAKES